MRPDVALAFDRLARAASAGWDLAGDQLRLPLGCRAGKALRPAPRPPLGRAPGRSLHRCATELDLGPSSAYGWLAAHAPRFGFVRRYSWEAWHFGFVRGPAPCSPAADGPGFVSGSGDGGAAGAAGLPTSSQRASGGRSCARRPAGTSPPALLAAQLLAESNFNPYAVSAAGAQGIAQFMPATAGAYGLDDPFDAPVAIDAQAHLMSDLLGQFGAPCPWPWPPTTPVRRR